MTRTAIVVVALLALLVAVAGYLGWRQAETAQRLEGELTRLGGELAELREETRQTAVRAEAAEERAAAQETRAEDAETRAAVAEERVVELADEASDAETRALAARVARRQAEERAEKETAARRQAEEARQAEELERQAAEERAKSAELEARLARMEAEEVAARERRLREERARDLDRLENALASIAETRRTALGVVMNLGDSIEFDFNRAELRPENRELLSRIAGVLMTATVEDYQIQVFGHTDDVGDPEYNVELSRRRAQSVRDYLVEAGVDPAIISTQGFGKSSPLVEGTSDAARQRNRRVEIAVIQTAGELASDPIVTPGGGG